MSGQTAAMPMRVAPMLRAFARDLGTLGLAGLLLLLAAAPAWWAMVLRPQHEAAELKAEIARLRARRLSGIVRPPERAAAQIDRFRSAFPAVATIPVALADLSRLATEHRVVLASGDYRLVEESPLGMLRYEVRYPVRGAWRDVFTLLAAMLNAVPGLSLDEVVFKRESQGAAEVDAQLRLSLFFVAGETASVAGPPPASRAAPAPRRGGGNG